MNVTKIAITKSRTLGIASTNKTKFNKVTVMMEAELVKEDDVSENYIILSDMVDLALEKEVNEPPKSILEK